LLAGLSGTGALPTPDQVACYLPFHYFEDGIWGVYIFDEEFVALLTHLIEATGDAIPRKDIGRIVLRFCFYHEVFHHKTEAFATRLEVTHRKPLYRTGFERLYRRTRGTDDHLEEALACAHSLRRLDDTEELRKLPDLREALLAYLENLGPGYRRVREFLTNKAFTEGQARFAEDNQAECLGSPPVDPRVWLGTGHLFDPMGSRFSKFIYHIRRGDPRIERIPLRPLLKPRKVLKILRDQFGVTTEEGAGHTKLFRPNGARSTLPRHKRDVANDTLRRILQQLEIPLSLRDFQQLGSPNKPARTSSTSTGEDLPLSRRGCLTGLLLPAHPLRAIAEGRQTYDAIKTTREESRTRMYRTLQTMHGETLDRSAYSSGVRLVRYSSL